MGLVTEHWVYFDLVWDVGYGAYRLMDIETGAFLEQDGYTAYFLSPAAAEKYLVENNIRATIRAILGGQDV